MLSHDNGLNGLLVLQSVDELATYPWKLTQYLEGNLDRIKESIHQAKDANATLRVGVSHISIFD